MDSIIYSVDEEDGIFYVFDPEGKAVASYCSEDEAQDQADKLSQSKYLDRVEEAACRADFEYDQMRDRQMFGEEF
jgi:hypothetical protein